MIDHRAAISFLPTTAVLELTYACQHRCRFCSCPWEADDGRFARLPEQSLEDWKELITQLCELGVTSIAFTGGEPTMKRGWRELVHHAAAQTAAALVSFDGELEERRRTPELSLLSNGTGLDDAAIALCAELRVKLSLSLPGLDTFAEHTGGFTPDAVLHWFGRAQAAGITTTVGITVTARNRHELARTIAVALISGADRVLLNRFLPGGRGLGNRDLDLTAEQVVEALDVAEEILRRAGRYGSLGTEVPRCLVDGSRYTHLQVSHGCAAAKGFFVIDPSGHLRVCNHSPVRLRHWRQLDEVRQDPYWRRFALSDHLPHTCIGCRHAGGCNAGCREAAHLTSGAVDGFDPLGPPWR